MLQTTLNNRRHFQTRNMYFIMSHNIKRFPTILPAKSDSDVMFCLQSYQGLESIDHLCINPIRRIGIIHK